MSGIQIPYSTVEGFRTVTVEPDDGYDIFMKIQDKATRYMEETGREAKYIIIDAESYLTLYAHLSKRRGDTLSEDITYIYTPAGPLTPVVLPQTSKRIQVVGDQMFTATRTLAEKQYNA